ncbi:MAG: tRNA lysidine(34) synthetase TilS [Prevotella sp.]|nr:tRNA lysidine(34) synthetase TilS [Prevotella sp.]
MLNKVRDYIKKYKLLDTNELYLVALSGGADSVALLLLLDEMGYQTHAIHCNFHLRGEESDRDERFCESLCQQKNIPFHRVHFDTLMYAETHKVSVEMAARELRYHYFEQLRNDIGAAGVCVAHHRDDTVETVLLNLVRGTGLRGLTGIQPKNGNILRPLLCLSRKEIEAYLRTKGQEYVTDSTNLEADVQRNVIRLKVLPLLQELNPAVSENIQRTAENLLEAQQVLDAVSNLFDDVKELELNELKKFGSSEYIVYQWAKQYGFNGAQVRQIMEAETGRVFSSPAGYDLLVDRGRLLVEPSLKPMKPLLIPEEGTYVLDHQMRLSVKKEPAWISKDAAIATVDASKVRFPLTVRRVEEGDVMQPFGMEGRKLLSDLMTDRKMTLFEKRRQLVVTDADHQVVWLVGIRTDHRFRVLDTTTEVLTLSQKHV